MLVIFSTDAYGDVQMFGDIALSMLKMMGHSGTIPSAILAEDIPAALNRLTAAIDKTKGPAPDKDMDEVTVSLAHRALPLIALLTAATRANANVMWK